MADTNDVITNNIKTKTSTIATNGVSTGLRFRGGSIENARQLRVVCIGAGFSGIYMGIRVPQRLKNINFTIYEKNGDVGGTWLENRYPGLACNIPAHCYQYSFEPNPEWSKFYAEGREIWGYLKNVAKKYSVERFIKPRHKVVKCEWKADEGKWEVVVERSDENGAVLETIVDKAHIVINAHGFLNVPKYPDISGLPIPKTYGSTTVHIPDSVAKANDSEPRFKGAIVHSGNWPEGERFVGKKIAVIGTGSSGIQIVPNLQPDVERLDLYVRGRTWISTSFVQMDLGEEGRKYTKNSNFNYTEADINRFKSDPEFFFKYRKTLEHEFNGVHAVTLTDSEMQNGAVKAFTELMQTRLASKPEIFNRLLPEFPVACRRLTPGPGYLEALTQDNVNFVSTGIKRITETGIEDMDGNIREIDAIVCATGFQTGTAPPFPIIGTNGLTLERRWAQYPEAYLSLVCDSFPNMFAMLGPNAGVGSGSLTIVIERTGDYILKAIRKYQKEGIKAMTVKEERVKEWSEYVDGYFAKTVFMGDCTSWYRLNGNGPRIIGLWPGSCLHAIEALSTPRWEDFDYEYEGEENGNRVNRLGWLGDGWTDIERQEKDKGYYLNPDVVDVPMSPFPEKVWEEQAFYH